MFPICDVFRNRMCARSLCESAHSGVASMSPNIVRTAFVLIVFATGSAVAQTSDEKQARAEVALSNDTLQLRYLGDAGSAYEGSKMAGTFFLSEQRDIVLSAAM